MITSVRGVLRAVHDDSLTLSLGPIDVDILIPECARRPLQGRLDEIVALHSVFYIDGNQMGGRMTPRLVGFLSAIDREFFEILCSVDGMGVRKSLRAMVRPVRDLARMIHDRDVKLLATFPGIGEAMAERIVAKTRRKVVKFTMIAESIDPVGAAAGDSAGSGNGHPVAAEPDVIQDAYAALLSVGHSESQARERIERVLAAGKRRKFSSVADLIEAIYEIEKPTS